MDEDDKKGVKLVAGFLATALDIEDDMSGEVYGQFLDREAWPANLDEGAFQTIKGVITIIIQETEDHKKEFLNLKNKL